MEDLIMLAEQDGIAKLMLNRPSSFNAFNLAMIDLLANHLTTIAENEKISAVVISGEGKAFCAGGDIKWAFEYAGGAPSGFHLLAARFHQAVLEMRRMTKPVIAAINGVAAGGGFTLALACDFRVMARSAVLRQAYTSAGLCIDGGGTFTLPRMVGLARALEITAFDKPISSEQALSWGLVTRVVDDGRALDEALQMVQDIKTSLNSFGWCKNLFNDSCSTPFEAQIERERFALSRCSAHADGQEGLQAFANKRKPVFKR